MSVSRRTILASGALAGAAAVAPPWATNPAHAAPAQPQLPDQAAPWTPVPPVDLGSLSPDLFGDDELTLPYHLHHLHTVANAVVEEGEHRGWFDIHVWRGSAEQHPEQVRIMELIAPLAYFYVTDRPWNVYRHSEPLRQRLETAIGYWISLQNEDGVWPFDNGGDDHGWPYQSITYGNTCFTVRFMAQTLVELDGDPTIDPELLARARAATRRGIIAMLTLPDKDSWYEHVAQYSNQYTLLWPAALAYLHLGEDDEVRQAMLARMRTSFGYFQSPTGHMYEGHGVDWRYTLSTAIGSNRQARHYALLLEDRDEVVSLLNDELQRWTEFLAYNSVHEPDGTVALNRAVETRSEQPHLELLPEPGSRAVMMARAFSPSVAQIADLHQRQRARLEASWPEVAPLPIGSFSAYAPAQFYHRGHVRWYPNTKQRAAAMELLPSRSATPFTHQRTDPRGPISYTFVRRGNYYAVFNSGTPTRAWQQRFGLGLLSHEGFGAVAQTQTGAATDGAWGTRVGDTLYERDELLAEFTVGEEQIVPATGNHDLPEGDLKVRYDLDGHGSKDIRFLQTGIHVSVIHPGAFAEDIPLVFNRDTDTIVVTETGVTLSHGDATFKLITGGVAQIELIESDHQLRDDPSLIETVFPWEDIARWQDDPTSSAKTLTTVRIHATDSLHYRACFPR